MAVICQYLLYKNIACKTVSCQYIFQHCVLKNFQTHIFASNFSSKDAYNVAYCLFFVVIVGGLVLKCGFLVLTALAGAAARCDFMTSHSFGLFVYSTTDSGAGARLLALIY